VPVIPLSEPLAEIVARCELTHSSVPQLMVSARSSRNNPRFVRSDACWNSKAQQHHKVRVCRSSVSARMNVRVFAWGVGVCVCVCVCLQRLRVLPLSVLPDMRRAPKSGYFARSFPENGTEVQNRRSIMFKFTVSHTCARSLRESERQTQSSTTRVTAPVTAALAGARTP